MRAAGFAGRRKRSARADWVDQVFVRAAVIFPRKMRLLLVKDLLRDNCEVLTLEDLSKGHRDLVCGGTFIKVGVGDAALLDEIFSTYPIDAVMHFAAYSIVGESVENPLDYYRNNVAATAELLSAMVSHGVKRFIFSSTAALYGEPSEVPIKEDHPCDPTNPYGATKRVIEDMLRDLYAYSE